MGGHDGHRERMRRAFEERGETMTDAQLLELLLFYSIPRRDVRPLAERLAAGPEGLAGIMRPDRDLSEISGVGENTARLLRLTAEASRRAALGPRPGALITSPESAAEYLRGRLRGLEGDVVMGIFLDERMRVIACSPVDLTVEDIAWQAAGFDSKAVILGAGYRDGHYSPDISEAHAVRTVREGLLALEIALLDYLIIGRTRYTSLYCDRILRPEESFRTRYRPERDSSRVSSWAESFTAHEL